MTWTNIKDGEKGGNLARVINGALLTTGGGAVGGGSGADSIFVMNELASFGITPDTQSRIIVQGGDVSLTTTLTRSIWGNGLTANQPVLIASTALEVVSASTDDDVAGIGAQKLYVEGVSGTGTFQSGTFDMDGTTPVPIGLWLEVNIAEVTQVGSSGANAGAITIRTVSGSTAQAVIPAALRGNLNQIRYRVASGRIAFVRSILFGSMGTGPDTAALPGANMIMNVDRVNSGVSPGPGVLLATQPFRATAYRGAPTPMPFDYGFPLFAGNVIRPQAANGTANTVEFTCIMTLEEFIL